MPPQRQPTLRERVAAALAGRAVRKDGRQARRHSAKPVRGDTRTNLETRVGKAKKAKKHTVLDQWDALLARLGRSLLVWSDFMDAATKASRRTIVLIGAATALWLALQGTYLEAVAVAAASGVVRLIAR